MDFAWNVADEPPEPAPEGPADARRPRRGPLVLVAATLAALVVAASWIGARRQVAAVEREVAMAAAAALRAARDGDAEGFLAVTGRRLRSDPRDTATGVAVAMPGLIPGGPPRLSARVTIPAKRGAAPERAAVRMAYTATLGGRTGRFWQDEAWVRRGGRWLLASEDTRLATAALFALPTVDAGRALDVHHRPGGAREAERWAAAVAPTVQAYCETEGLAGLQAPSAVCPVAVALAGRPGEVAVQKSGARWILVLPAPGALPQPASPAAEAILRDLIANNVIAFAARIATFERSDRSPDPLGRALSGAAGAPTAFEAALLREWLAARGVAAAAAAPPPPPPDAVSWVQLDQTETARSAADALRLAAAYSAAAHVAHSAGVDRVPALLAAFRTHQSGYAEWEPAARPAEAVRAVLGAQGSAVVASWPRPAVPFPGESAATVQCYGAPLGLLVPGATGVEPLSPCADAPVSAAVWAPDGSALAVTCGLPDPPPGTMILPREVRVLAVPRDSPSLGPPATYPSNAPVCCVSWSPGAELVSWSECCPARARVAPNPARRAAEARSPGDASWLHGWASGESSWPSHRFDHAEPWPASWLHAGGLRAAIQPQELIATPRTLRWAGTELVAAWLPRGPSPDWEGGFGVGAPSEAAPAWSGEGYHPTFAPLATEVASLTRLSGPSLEVQVARAADGRLLERFVITATDVTTGAMYLEAHGLGFSPDGRWLLASGRGWSETSYPGVNFVAAWRRAGGTRRIFTLDGTSTAWGWLPGRPASLVIGPGPRSSPAGTQLNIRAVDLASGRSDALATIDPARGGGLPPTSVGAVSFSPSGRQMLVESEQGELTLVESGAIVWRHGASSCRAGPWRPAG